MWKKLGGTEGGRGATQTLQASSSLKLSLNSVSGKERHTHMDDDVYSMKMENQMKYNRLHLCPSIVTLQRTVNCKGPLKWFLLNFY